MDEDWFEDEDEDEESSFSSEPSVSVLSTSNSGDYYTPSTPSGTSTARKLTRHEIVTATAEFAKAATPQELAALRNQILAIAGDLELPDPRDNRRIVDF